MLLHHDHDHDHIDKEARQALASYIWHQETVDLTTVGIDIGSSTSHLLIATIRLQRRSQALSSRFEVTDRKVIFRSPIMLTPFLSDGTIDVVSLESFIHETYAKAGYNRSDIDSGAVILTGEAIKKKNARVIDELFAEEAGKFVCATAGHKLECTLAAHGSGAVKLSEKLQQCILHIDIGGGTTKLALIEYGKIIGVSAFAVGGRLLAMDESGQWSRVDDSARLAAEDLGLQSDPSTLNDERIRQQIATRLAEVCVDFFLGKPLDRLGMLLQLTERLPDTPKPQAISFSGGVSEYLLRDEENDYGDIAIMLASQLKDLIAQSINLPIHDPGQGIHATVIGASQFTVQVSGKTIFLPENNLIPVHNVPVVNIGLDLEGEINPKQVSQAISSGLERMELSPQSLMAVAFSWHGEPAFQRLNSLGQGIVSALGGKNNVNAEPLLLMIDGDIGRTMGNLLCRELGLSRGLVSIDGVKLQELDYVDIGEIIDPPGVVPIVIKSLLFS